MVTTNVTPPESVRKALVAKGEAIYQEKYKEEYEEKYKGKYAAIHVDSEEAFIGDTRTQAYYEAIKKHPNQYFYFKRIGLPPFRKNRMIRRKKSQ